MTEKEAITPNEVVSQAPDSTGEEVIATPQQTEQPAADLTPEGRQMANMLIMVQDNPEMAKDPKIAEFLNKVNEVKKSIATPASSVEKEIESPVAKTESATKTLEKNQDNQKEADETEDEKSVFFGGKTNKVELKTAEDWQKFIKDKFSIDDPTKLASTVNKWRKDSQEKTELTKTKESYEQLFNELPEPIYKAIQTWGNAGDWLNEMKKSIPAVDYSKDFDKHDLYEVVNGYFPGKFDKQELSGKYDELDPTVQKAVDVSKQQFNINREQFNGERAKLTAKATAKAEALKASALSSVKNLEDSLPNFSEKALKEVEKILMSGDTDSLLYTKEGLYRPDAAKRLSFLLYGEQEVSKVKKTRDETQKELHNSVSRKSDTPKTTTSQQSVPKNDKLVETIKQLIPQNYY